MAMFPQNIWPQGYMALVWGEYVLDWLRPPTAGARGGVHGIKGAEVAREGNFPRLHLDQDRAVRPVF